MFCQVPLIEPKAMAYLSDLLGSRLLQETLEDVLLQLEDVLSELDRPYSPSRLRRLAHEHKGLWGVLGLERLVRVADAVEMRCRRGQAVKADRTLFRAMLRDTIGALGGELQPEKVE